MFDLSVIVVSWNTRKLLEDCLCSVCETAGDLALEVFVVDNASTDGSAEMARVKFPHAHLIQNQENVGFARANNQAMLQSRARYVLLLNSDTEIRPGALDALVGFMDAHPQAGAVGPYLLNADGSLQPSCHPLPTPWREFWRLMFLDALLPRASYPLSCWDGRAPHRVEVIKGACLMLRREALEQMGLLDEHYFMYTEEMDLCHRLARAGWELYWLPTARVVHYGAGSTRQAAETMYVQLYRSKVQFHRKFGGERRVRWFKGLITLAYLPRWVVALVGSPFAQAWAVRAHTYRRLLAELPRM